MWVFTRISIGIWGHQKNEGNDEAQGCIHAKKNEEKVFICWKLQRVGLVNHPPLELAKPLRWKHRWFLSCVSLFYLGEYFLITNITPIHFTPYLHKYLHRPLNQPFSAMPHTYTAIIALFYYSSDSFRLTSFDFFFGL